MARNSNDNALIEKIKALEEENQYLRCLLQKHDIPFARKPNAPPHTPEQPVAPTTDYSVEERINSDDYEAVDWEGPRESGR